METKQEDKHTWRSKIDISGLENNVDVEFYVEKDCKPNQGQIEDVEWLAKNFNELKNDIEQGVYVWYQLIIELHNKGEWLADYESIPEIEDSSGIWQYLEEPRIFSSFLFGQLELSLSFCVDWDLERGVKISLSARKIDYIGQ